MPRKLREVKRRIDLPLTAAWTWTLMTGELGGPHRDYGLPGWVAQAQDDYVVTNGEYSYTPAGNQLWKIYGTGLTAEAKGFNFVPFWATSRTPSGEGFERWCTAFVAAHRRIPPIARVDDASSARRRASSDEMSQ